MQYWGIHKINNVCVIAIIIAVPVYVRPSSFGVLTNDNIQYGGEGMVQASYNAHFKTTFLLVVTDCLVIPDETFSHPYTNCSGIVRVESEIFHSMNSL